MPLVRIDVNQGRTPGQLQVLSRGIHDAMVAEYGIPAGLLPRPDRTSCWPESGPGCRPRLRATPDVVMIQTFTQSGRSQEAKQSLFAAIAERLAAIGVASGDVFIGYVENTTGDWSFGFGRAQYVTGGLGVPSR